ncbi:hmg1, hmg-CoA reductase [Polychaeton citri CBS 116435]|uniref:3-hydroxy-3-methylglutaryl coenzyme A reductase n=1 Tax=Polychaeton citri CBS 116435 TaxID=1314669 RepID=A0A9P4QF54_9PEZI|nr:hmg1, hmg-CoA reductase [Polychaeton citri CBS 116435]
MLFSNLIPTRWRRNYDITDPKQPGFYNRRITPYLQSISSTACTHPIHTLAFFAILASTTYISLLETGFFRPSTPAGGLGTVDFAAVEAGSRRLHLGQETGWKWQLEENGSERHVLANDTAVLTLVFPESGANGFPSATPSAHDIALPEGVEADVLPAASKSSEHVLVYSMPYSDAHSFLEGVQEIPTPGVAETPAEEADDEAEKKMWILSSANSAKASSNGLVEWAQNSWTAFTDLLKHAETLDIIIMGLGYLSMYLTFTSLFLSMRKLGSNFWLGTTVLFSSAFAFLFGLVVTLKMGVPVNVVLLSEGLPFLVVTVGFEKPIILTQAVLSASLQAKRSAPSSPTSGNSDAPLGIQNAVQQAVHERGFQIVRDFLVEIAILAAGAASGIQGGLRQFCFLAAWTLFFDCILLFTFYTAVLTIKLEINRIKRHVAIRKALEEDGVSRRVAESVASSNEWPRDGTDMQSSEASIFGRKVRDSSIPRFKVLMVTGFICINVFNLATMPFRASKTSSPVATAGLSSVVTQPPMDPFKVADGALAELYAQATNVGQSLSVTVFSPIKYQLEYPSVYYAAPVDTGKDWNFLDSETYTENYFSNVGGRVVESLLKSFEDPVLSKWIIIALAMSLVLNGYLFNAARWSIKEPEQAAVQKSDAETQSKVSHAKQPSTNGQAIRPVTPVQHCETEKTETPTSPTLANGTTESRKRSRSECEEVLKNKQAPSLTDSELVDLSLRGKIPGYALEKTLADTTRAVKIRRAVISRTPATAELSAKLEKSKLPYLHFDYDRVFGACCENVVGYLPLPLGLAGPLIIDGKNYFLPMATTEGVLVASASRGCKAINAGGGAITVLTGDGMTRGPCIGFETLTRAAAAKVWIDGPEGQRVMREAFNSTSRFARLQQLKTSIAGTYVYVRFKTTTGDAMGMNMISKGVEEALRVMKEESGFEDMAIITVSGNFCTDKKPAAINWVDGRGKSVVAEAIIPGDVVRNVLKSDVNALVELNISKNLIGSAMAGSIGGFNAHAANMVTAIFLATGQDPAQNVESSNCITVMKNLNGNLQISVSMPSIEVGTIGGGTILEPQAAMLDLLGVRGAHPTTPGANAQQLARIVAAGVLAGELSLCSALAAGHLVRAHMSHNRSQAPSRAVSPKGLTRTSASSAEAARKGSLNPVGVAVGSMVEKAGGTFSRR